MNYTKIEYLDLTWNPFIGCSGINCAVSRVCWAYWQAKRQKPKRDIKGKLIRGCESCYLFHPHVHFERFNEPLKRKKPSQIGLCFSSDFFDRTFSESLRASIKLVIEKAYWHNFLALTKQPQNIDLNEPIPDNLALGISVNLKKDLWRLDALRKVHVKLRVASFEPLLEDLGEVNLEGFGWMIIGAQTRPSLQPKHEWIHRLTANALARDIPVFHKNNLLIDGKSHEIPKEFMVDEK